MAYTASNLLNAQAKLLGAFQSGELRARIPATYLEFLKNSQIMFPNFQELRTREDRTLVAYYLKRASRALGAARLHNHTGTVGESGTLTPSWATYADVFTYTLKQGNNNMYSLDEMTANEIVNVMKNFSEGLETAATTFAFNNRSGVNSCAIGGTFDAGDDVFQIKSTDEKKVGLIVKSMMDINKYSGVLTVFCDTALFNKMYWYANQGQANSENTAFQFAGINWVHSVGLYTSAAALGYTEGFGITVASGLIGALPHIPKENVQGIETKVNKYGTILNPIDGQNYAVHEYVATLDGTGTGGYTQDVKTEVQVSIDIAFEDAPLSTANETVLQAFGFVGA